MDFAPEQLWVVALAGLLIFGGAVGKSAQFPLHIWLPDAMEGPTTVSALIHAATMVKAGVYLVARSMPLLVQAPDVLLVIAAVGGFTALLAATMACVNFDIKRVLAYSTISQLGYMFLGLGAGGYAYYLGTYAAGYTAGLFHLMTHAFFKALLFLSAGSVMHALAGITDLRKMGGLYRYLKFTAIAMLIGAAANAGLPPTSGFFSKDELLAAVLQAAQQGPPWLLMAWAFGFVTVALTAFYLFRLWFMAFAGRPRWDEGVKPHESPPLMTGPLGLLATLALIAGIAVFSFGYYITFGKPHVLPPAELLHAITTSPTSMLSIVLVLGGIVLAYGLYVRSWSFKPITWAQRIYTLLQERYYLDHLAGGIASGVLQGAVRLDDADLRGVDGAVDAIAEGSAKLGVSIRRAVTGYVGTYAAWTVIGVLIIWLLLAFGGGR
jgi:NADH-quinone oxidoreductase subunit L